MGARRDKRVSFATAGPDLEDSDDEFAIDGAIDQEPVWQQENPSENSFEDGGDDLDSAENDRQHHYDDPERSHSARGPYHLPTIEQEVRDLADNSDSGSEDAFDVAQDHHAVFEAALQDEVENFRSDLIGAKKPKIRRQGRQPGLLGPRKPPEPSLEIKLLLGQANQAYLKGHLEEAVGFINEIIKQNAEIYSAWTTLGEVFRDQGEQHKALLAFFSAAHLRPKESALWVQCAQQSLELLDEDPQRYLGQAIYCYNCAIRANPRDIWLYRERSKLYEQNNELRRALVDLKRALKLLPHDLVILTDMARIQSSLGQINQARMNFAEAFAHFRTVGRGDDETVGFSDLNVYAELLGDLGEYSAGVAQIRSVSRWFLGREDQTFWDNYADDREWDLDDDMRRAATLGFVAGAHQQESYGLGLPLELRIKLGTYRLKSDHSEVDEAMLHFNWLNPMESGPASKLANYPDLFRDAADTLQGAGCFKEAIIFYEPLVQLQEGSTSELYLKLGHCYRETRNYSGAQECYEVVIGDDEHNMEARVELAKVYEELGQPEQAYAYIAEVIQLRRDRGPKRSKEYVAEQQKAAELARAIAVERKKERAKKPPPVSNNERIAQEKRRSEKFRSTASTLDMMYPQATIGDLELQEDWVDSAEELLADFRNCSVFYPSNNKYLKFQGYTRKYVWERSEDLEISEIAGRLEKSMEMVENDTSDQAVPTEYRGISFQVWLELFLRYAILKAKLHESEDCYEALQAAYDANVFYHSKADCRRIHMHYAACALHMRDEDALSQVCRWFHRQRPDDDSAIRLFATTNRLCQPLLGDNSIVFNNAANQKFWLRQIRMIDTAHHARSNADADGDITLSSETSLPRLRAAMLTLYGQILMCGGSTVSALNYYFRAHVLAPDNPVIVMCIAVSYILRAVRRTALNRHYHIMQGFSFMFAYYELRHSTEHVHYHQEAAYNVARAFHAIGLGHMAIPYYEEVLDLSSNTSREDLAAEAAYNLRAVYESSGNMEMSMYITKRYLAM